MSSKLSLSCAVISANTGADAIQKAPIVDYDTGIRCLRIGDLSNNRKFDDWGFTQIEDKYYENFKLLKDDIFIARTGNTIGVNTIIKLENIKAVFNNGMIRLRIDKEKFDPLFIYYIISSKQMQEYIQSIAYGTSTQPNMKINDLLRYEFENISLTGQKKISHILSTLDDKIELNRKMNQTLESMASAIFKSWFVDFDPVHAKANCEGEAELENIAKELGISKAILDLFPSEFEESELGMIPKGWEVKTLDKILTVNPTYSIKKGTLSKYVELSKLSTSLLSIDNYEFREFVGGGAKFKNGDTILVRITPSLENGKRAFVDFLDDDEIGCGSTEYIILSAKKEIQEWSYLLSISESFRNYAISNMNGSSGRQRVPNDAVKEYKISAPSDEIFTNFSCITNLLFKNIKSNTEQIRTLQKTRDTLLPKLLSGEIDVSELKN